MRNIRCIIIEDEFPASEILKSYLGEIPGWEIIALFDNAIDAISYLSDNEVDVVFVDIKLPKLSGISFVKILEKPPIIVITTAYSEHAIEAFELVVFDYLLKPYSFERFVKTINRINAQLIDKKETETQKRESGFILVKENRNQIKLFLEEICYVESQKEYVKIVCEQRTIKTKTGITKMAEILPGNMFIRIHRSFVVQKNRIDAFTTKKVSIKNQLLPIGRFYQKEVRSELENLKRFR